MILNYGKPLRVPDVLPYFVETKTDIMNNADQPIYPDPMRGTGESYYNQSPDKLPCGLTKREHFAGLALQGLCANYLRDNVTGWEIKSYAVEAVELADALLKQLETTQAD